MWIVIWKGEHKVVCLFFRVGVGGGGVGVGVRGVLLYDMFNGRPCGFRNGLIQLPCILSLLIGSLVLVVTV